MPESNSRGVLLSSLSAVTAMAAAVACCIPTGAILAAIGFAGASRYQPWFMAFSVAALATGVVIALRARQCSPRRRRFNLVVLALCAVFVLPVLIYPQGTAGFLADLSLSRARSPAGQPPPKAIDLRELRDAFNASAGEQRIIAMFSPT